MASIIKSDNGVSSGITGIVQSADSSGQLVLQTTTSGGTATTAVTIDNTQVATFANTLKAPNLQGPAFSVYGSATQSIASATYTKIAFNTKLFDTANAFDSTTNYRFTPTVAGYYQFNVQSLFYAGTGVGYISFYKNGSIYSNGQSFSLNITTNLVGTTSCLISLNGSTDYVEIYCYQTTSGNLSVGSNGSTVQFNGSMVRSS